MLLFHIIYRIYINFSFYNFIFYILCLYTAFGFLVFRTKSNPVFCILFWTFLVDTQLSEGLFFFKNSYELGTVLIR